MNFEVHEAVLQKNNKTNMCAQGFNLYLRVVLKLNIAVIFNWYLEYQIVNFDKMSWSIFPGTELSKLIYVTNELI